MVWYWHYVTISGLLISANAFLRRGDMTFRTTENANMMTQKFDRFRSSSKAFFGREATRLKTNPLRRLEYGDVAAEAKMGMMRMFRGFQNGDKAEVMAGTLDIISGFSVMIGGTKGPLISGALSLLSSMIGLFGSQPKSTAEIIREALKAQSDEDLNDEVRGMLYKLETLQNTLGSYKVVLEESKNDANIEQKTKFFNNMARKLSNKYLTMTDGVRGYFTRSKSEYCSIASTSKLKGNVQKCLKIIKLYADLTAEYQFAMLGIQTFVAESDPTTADTLKSRLQRHREKDMVFLKFLGDPYNNRGQRLAAAALWENSWFCSTAFNYLSKLHNYTEGKFFSKEVLLCNVQSLREDCTTYAQNDYPDVSGWDNQLDSAFIPEEYKLEIFIDKNFGGRKAIYYGPLVVHRFSMGSNRMSSFKVKKIEEGESYSYNLLRLCIRGSGDLYMKHYCQQFTYGRYPNLRKLDSGLYDIKHVDKIFVPSGMKVISYLDINYVKPGAVYVGPLYTYVYCAWKSMEIKAVNLEGYKLLTISNGRPPASMPGQTEAQVQQIDICEGKYGKVKKIIETLPIAACPNIREFTHIKVPGEVEVTGYTASNFKGGKFLGLRGPSGWKKVEGGKWKSMEINADCGEPPNDEEDLNYQGANEHAIA